jgi:hypothetical protein
MLKLPSAGQTFETIRTKNLLYVDKTKFIYEILQEEGLYFISRPRRFGKSLLLGTLFELLNGNRDLFKDLWIDSSDYDFKKLPVLSINMTGDCKNEAVLEETLQTELQRLALLNGLGEFKTKSPSNMLKDLITTIKNQSKEKVTILIDEYDFPIQSVIDDVAQANANRLVLHSFYATLKGLADQNYIKLIFVTGVTKFTQASVFSVFNNYKDMTLDTRFASICGFTIDEFHHYFTDYIPNILEYNKSHGFVSAETDRDSIITQILQYYDGYSWDGETRVLNPYSLIQMFDSKLITSFWFRTGTPSFLIKFLKQRYSEFSFPEDNIPMSANQLDAVDIGNLKLVPIMFQTGYLTVDKRTNPMKFLLKCPNQEVKEALNSNLLEYLLGLNTNSIAALKNRILTALENFDSLSLSLSFKDILSWNSYQELIASEGQYHALIYSVLKALRFNVLTQPSSSEGVFDILITLGKRVAFICEFKYEVLHPKPKMDIEKKTHELLKKALKRAKQQISDKKYDAGYYQEYQVVKKLAVGFVGHTNVIVEIY